MTTLIVASRCRENAHKMHKMAVFVVVMMTSLLGMIGKLS